MTLSPDGSFSLLDSTNKPSAGTWQIKDGVFIMAFTTAPDAGMVGIEYKCKIVRLDDHELIYAGRGHNIELKR